MLQCSPVNRDGLEVNKCHMNDMGPYVTQLLMSVRVLREQSLVFPVLKDSHLRQNACWFLYMSPPYRKHVVGIYTRM